MIFKKYTKSVETPAITSLSVSRSSIPGSYFRGIRHCSTLPKQWSDGVEQILIDHMNDIAVCKTKGGGGL